jgi:hypothetical protein
MSDQQTQILSLLRSEFNYWQDAPVDHGIIIGATGAVSNVMAAVVGHPAPWHNGEYAARHPIWPAEVKVWGWSWLGGVRIRVLLPAGHKTFWHLTLTNWFSIGLSFPRGLTKFWEK